MHKSRFTEEQIINVLKEHAAGLKAPPLPLCVENLIQYAWARWTTLACLEKVSLQFLSLRQPARDLFLCAMDDRTVTDLDAAVQVQSLNVAVANRQAEIMMRIASVFGFTPASSSRISTADHDQENEWIEMVGSGFGLGKERVRDIGYWVLW